MIEKIKNIIEAIKTLFEIPYLMLKVNIPYIFGKNPRYYIGVPTKLTAKFFNNNKYYDIDFHYGWSIMRLRK